jgi:hypothetical protein
MNRSTDRHRHLSMLTAVLVGGAMGLVLPAAAAESGKAAARTGGGRAVATKTVVDSAVRPAGGLVCHDCGPAACRHGKHGHHRDCRDGVCAPYCPVRPGTYGYYGTQWRRWPGQGVVPVSNVEAATPVKPPKSEVPGADEESLGPKPDDLPEPADRTDDDAGTRSRRLPPEPDAPLAVEPAAPEPTAPEPAAPEPTTLEPTSPEPRAMPLDEPAAPSRPAVEETPPAKPKTDDLFDDSAARKVRRKIPVQSAGGTRSPEDAAAGVKPTSHEATRPAPRPVPRVAFDPQAESARMRGTR